MADSIPFFSEKTKQTESVANKKTNASLLVVIDLVKKIFTKYFEKLEKPFLS